MSLESNETNPYPDTEPAGHGLADDPPVDGPGCELPDPYDYGPDAHNGVGGTVTYEEAMKAIDAMEISGHAGTFDDVQTTGITYEEAIRQIDAMGHPAAHAEPVPAASADVEAPGHEEAVTAAADTHFAPPEGVEPSDASAGGDTLDLGLGQGAAGSVDAANTDLFSDVQIPVEDTPPQPADDGTAPRAEHTDIVADDDALAHADTVVDSTAHGAEPPGDETIPLGAAAFAGTPVAYHPETDHSPNPFDDVTVRESDGEGAAGFDAADDRIDTHRSAEDAAATEPAVGSAHAAGLQSASESPSPAEADVTFPGQVPEAVSTDVHGSPETNYVATHPPERMTDAPTQGEIADPVPVAAVPDPAEYTSHLHEMSSDDVLDSLAHQDSPELRQAALDELRSRLHADEAALSADHHAAAGDIVPAADDTHHLQADPGPSEQPEDVTPDIPVALSADDVDTLLNEKADQAGEDLQWQTSIVDLLKLLGIDSSQEAREHYAVELGFPQNELGDTSSSELNTWLHGQLLSTLAQNGGELPANLV